MIFVFFYLFFSSHQVLGSDAEDLSQFLSYTASSTPEMSLEPGMTFRGGKTIKVLKMPNGEYVTHYFESRSSGLEYMAYKTKVFKTKEDLREGLLYDYNISDQKLYDQEGDPSQLYLDRFDDLVKNIDAKAVNRFKHLPSLQQNQEQQSKALCERGIDLRRDPRIGLGPENLSVTDQYDWGHCYAHTSAAMIDIMRNIQEGTGPKQGSRKFRTSPTMLSHFKEGGFVCETINKVKNGEICTMEGSFGEDGVSPEVFSILRRRVARFYRKVNGVNRRRKKYTRERNPGWWKYNQEKIVGELCRLKKANSFSLDILPLQNLYDLFLDKPFEQAMTKWLVEGCKREKIQVPTCRDRHALFPFQYQKIIDDQLTQNPPRPVAINVCSALWVKDQALTSREKKISGTPIMHTSPICPSSDTGDGFEQHVVILVGKRWNSKTKSCDYIVRNSWGSCKKKYRNQTHPCEPDGYDIIPEKAVLENVTSLSVFE